MNRQTNTGEIWQFQVTRRGADRVFLVQESHDAASTWIEMSPVGKQSWELTHTVPPGHHRFRYFINEGGAFYNCGTEGLVAQRLNDRDASVSIEPFEMAMSA